MISGDAGVGKSHRLRRSCAAVHLDTPNAGTRASKGLVLPVCYVELAGPIQPKSLCGSILRFYDQMDVPGDLTRWIEACGDVMNKCGTTVLAIDEVQHLKLADNHGRKSFDVIKALMNRTSATVVAAGIDLRDAGIFAKGPKETQGEADRGAGRFDMHDMAPYRKRSKADVLAWIDIVAAMEENLVLLRSRPGDLVDNAEWLLKWTRGSMKELFEILNAATVVAVLGRGQHERITRALLDYVMENAREQRITAGK